MGGQPTDSNCRSTGSNTHSAASDSTEIARSKLSDSDISRSEGGSIWDSSDQSDTSISRAKEEEMAKSRSDQQLKEALKHMRHITSSPAATSIQDAFNWNEVVRLLPRGTAAEWYVVAFRSTRRANADSALLYAADAAAHAEALESGGLLVYFYGDMEADRRCLAMCVWDCAASARAAGTKPLHRRAAALAPLMYDMYQLERYRLVKQAQEERLSIEPLGRPLEFGRPRYTLPLSPQQAVGRQVIAA